MTSLLACSWALGGALVFWAPPLKLTVPSTFLARPPTEELVRGSCKGQCIGPYRALKVIVPEGYGWGVCHLFPYPLLVLSDGHQKVFKSPLFLLWWGTKMSVSSIHVMGMGECCTQHVLTDDTFWARSVRVAFPSLTLSLFQTGAECHHRPWCQKSFLNEYLCAFGVYFLVQ